jgi:hypothetical protein
MKTISIKKTAIAILAFVFSLGSASAAINLITAKNINDNSLARTSSDGGTTWDQTLTFPTTGSNIWLTDSRPNMIGGYSIRTESDLSDAPMMRITIATGLKAEQNYSVYGYYYDTPTGNWDIVFGDSPTNTTTYRNTDNGATDLSTLSQQQRDDKWEGFDGFNGLANVLDDYWHLAETAEHVMQADASGNLYAYVARGPDSGRTVLQGVGYEFHSVPEPETYALIFGGLTLGFVMLRRRIKG